MVVTASNGRAGVRVDPDERLIDAIMGLYDEVDQEVAQPLQQVAGHLDALSRTPQVSLVLQAMERLYRAQEGLAEQFAVLHTNPPVIDYPDLQRIRRTLTKIERWFSAATEMRPLQVSASPSKAVLVSEASERRIALQIVVPQAQSGQAVDAYIGSNLAVQAVISTQGQLGLRIPAGGTQ